MVVVKSKAGPSKVTSKTAASSKSKNASSSSGPAAPVPVNPSKLAANPRLPATMITPAGQVQQSSKPKGNNKAVSKKQKARIEDGKEKAIERAAALAEKVRGREERKVKRNRAKKAWE